MKNVLYISGNTACWVYFQNRKVVGVFEEPIEFENNTPYKPGSVAGHDSTEVHLLIDCSRSEIDAHPLLQTGSSWSYRSDKYALEKKLINQFPDAIVRSPAKKFQLGAIFVQHINLPIAVRNWLAHVECSGITFCSITTVAELLAERSGIGSECIVLSSSSELVRHTYCQSGHALFTRAVGYANKKEFAEQFSQTLSHLHACSLVEKPVSVHCVGLLEELVCDLDSHELVGELKTVSIENDSFPIWLAEQLQSSETIRSSNRHRPVSSVLKKYLQRRARKNRTQQYALLGTLVFASLVFTASSEWRRISDHKKYIERKAQLNLAIDMYEKEAAALSPQADVLASVLQDKLALESVGGISPAILLTIVAQLLTQFREFELQELSWTVLDSSTALSDEVPSITKVAMTGRLSGGESLREQQNSFNDFTAQLELHSELSNLEVLQTPLMQFDGTLRKQDGVPVRRPMFQLQFNLTRHVNNEA